MSDNIPILLVEDEPHIAQGIVYNLQEEGYQVTHVESGEAALVAAQENRYALIILDLMLPGIDGLEVCRKPGHFTRKRIPRRRSNAALDRMEQPESSGY